MEIYQLYDFVSTFLQTFFDTLGAVNPGFKGGFSSYGAWLFTSLAVAFGLWAILFVLQGFGLYYMAKKQNMPKRYLAFIPFASTLYMSKLAGKCSFFGRKMKNAGVYALIAQVLAFVICGLVVASQMYLYIGCGHLLNEVKETVGNVEVVTGVYWSGLTGFAKVVYNFYVYSSYIIAIFEFATEVLMLIVVLAIFKKYAPKNYFILSLLALFVPISRYIIIFVLKNKQPIDYDEWMRRRRADYFNRQQQANPYGNPYNNPYGTPYGNPQNGQGWQNGQSAQGNPQNGQSAPSDPFEEFSSNQSNSNGQNANSGENTQAGDSGGSDEFFN
ncbi:MAG: hypothetical protein IJ308_05615 [Clostridia bacterium]|nr:hypothetical protein [Clostridia bacterium]